MSISLPEQPVVLMARPWWKPDGAKVLAIRPYKGKYQQFFTHDVDIEAPNTRKGFLTTAVNTLQDPDWFPAQN